MNKFLKLAIAVLVVLALAEVSPEAVNAFLILLLIGILLGHWKSFAWLAELVGTLGD